jgi:hypothetical protein
MDSSFIDIVKQKSSVYIYGPPGIGKTYDVKRILKDYIELTYDILKNKSNTAEFIDRLRYSSIPILIDDFDTLSDLIGIKDVIDSLRCIIIGNTPWSMSAKVHEIQYPLKSIDFIKQLCREHSVDESIALRCKGDLRYIFNGPTDYKDFFQDIKQFVESMIHIQGSVNPRDSIGSCIEEHGHVSDIIHDNYIDADISLDSMCDILDSMSVSTIYDQKMYNGDWYLMPFFSFHSCVYPAVIIDHKLNTKKLRPGSIWTKSSNMKMRQKTLHKILRFSKISIDALFLLRDYVQINQIELLQEYHIDKSDIDTLNHIWFLKPIPKRQITKIKKLLSCTA